ncbi:MAG TPA: protein kinase [Labilithrix sp.]|nr:protein kinase [Labilithrix sp.]
MTAHDLAQRPEAPGERSALGARYRSLFVLGRGGMGTVEAALEIESSRAGDAHDASAYQRVVALKRLLPDAARDKRRTEMFLREARLAAMLDHPNVVRAYDYGELDGELYLSMEYVEGQPLSRVLRALADTGRRVDFTLVAYVLAEVCRGLHAAHELADPSTGAPLRLVHRDVSPQNVMIGYDGRVRLLDFGVAKIETENLTKTGEVKGKTAYMSPEQAMGEPLDRRSDLFGVGAVLFECLALRRMWGDGTDMDVIRKLALENPPALDTCGVDLPEGLPKLYARLVAHDPKDRPATALEVANALAAFVGDVDAVTEDLRALLDEYFSDQASEQRSRLTSSLDAVAPEHAQSLRESVLPSRASSPSRKSSAFRTGTPASALETRGAAVSPANRARLVVLGVTSLALAGGAAWWLAVTPHTPGAAPALATPSVASSMSSGTASAPTPTASAATASETASSIASSARPQVSSGRAPSALSARTRTPSPPVVTTSALPRAASVPKPPDIDEQPF